jgi:hypothetical protein
MLLVFQPLKTPKGLAFDGTSFREATIDRPTEEKATLHYVAAGRTEVWVYDLKTGEIFGKRIIGSAPRPPFSIYPGSKIIVAEHLDTLRKKTTMTLWSDDPPSRVGEYYASSLKEEGPVKTELVGDMVRVTSPTTLVTAQPLGGHTVIGIEDLENP